MMESKQHINKAKEIISSNIYCTVSTATTDGQPWISPVFYAIDDDRNLYWVSNKNALHSKLIRQNPRVAIVIFDSRAPEGDGDGVYIRAKALELNQKQEIEKAILVYNNRSTKEEFRIGGIEEVTNAGEWRIYKAVPEKIEKLTKGEYINGQYIERKVDITESL